MTDLQHLERLTSVLADIGPVAVALSGGVDSMTLAHVAHSASAGTEMFHAVSGAVPREATERVRRHGERAGWDLRVVDAGETDDERYLTNPVDRCFYCKTNLYEFIAANTALPIVSGTNTDDLGDYRPGLQAAANHDVVHPYVQAGLNKAAIRDLARHLELTDLAELPAAPCLSSRIETGLRVTPKRLEVVDEIERHLRDHTTVGTIRCRVRERGVVIEVDGHHVEDFRDVHAASVEQLLTQLGVDAPVTFEPYRQGGAFLHGVQA